MLVTPRDDVTHLCHCLKPRHVQSGFGTQAAGPKVMERVSLHIHLSQYCSPERPARVQGRGQSCVGSIPDQPCCRGALDAADRRALALLASPALSASRAADTILSGTRAPPAVSGRSLPAVMMFHERRSAVLSKGSDPPQ